MNGRRASLFLVEPESWSATQGRSSIGFDGDRTPERIHASPLLVYPDRFDLVIAGNLVQAFAPRMVTDIVKSTVDRACRTRRQVHYACAAGENEWNLNPPVVDSEFAAS